MHAFGSYQCPERDALEGSPDAIGPVFVRRAPCLVQRRARPIFMPGMRLEFPRVGVLPLERYAALLSEGRMQPVLRRVVELRARLAGRVVWNVSSTAVGGGVAEMVRSLLAYARGASVDARWVVIPGPPEFFRITKRLHNALHGSPGDGSPLDAAARQSDQRATPPTAP